MLSYVDVDKSGRFGISSRKEVYIFNLNRWSHGMDERSEFIKVDKGKRLSLKKSTEASSNLNSIFMDGFDDYDSSYPEIVKFGTHPRMFESFINIRGNSILYGNMESLGLDCISNQMMNITSFDWSPHFSTGTFVTTCDDALIRVSDIRGKNLDLSFMSFYNTKSIKWNNLNSYQLGALHENGEFISIYDLRVLKSIGIIPKNQWLINSFKKIEMREDKGIIGFSWLPLSSDKILICETDLLCIIDVSIAIENSKAENNLVLDFNNNNNLRSKNGIQYISLKNINISTDFEVLNFSSSSVDDDEDLGDDEGNNQRSQNQGQTIFGEVSKDFDWNNEACIKINSFDFLSGTNNLIINDKNGRFYYSEIKEHDDLGLRKLKMKFNGTVKKIFSSGNNELTLFGGAKLNSHTKSNSFILNDDELLNYNFYTTSLPQIMNKSINSKSENDKMFNLTLESFCIDWFYRDLNMIYDKVNFNQQMANNLISISIESNDRIIAKLSRHPTLRGKFVMEDNTEFNSILDSFEFTIILTTPQEKNNIKATYYITNNTILLIKEIFSHISIKEKFENNMNTCGHELKILQNYEHTSLYINENNCMQNIIPVRVYVDNLILNIKEREKLYELFGIEFDKELLVSLFSGIVANKNNQPTKQLVDWVWIISSLPELLLGLLIQNDGTNKEQQLELISSTRKHVYGIGFDQQALLNENHEKKSKISFTFHTLDKLILSQGSYLVVMKVNDEDNLNRAARYEKILIEINEMLRKVEYISEERFLYGDYFKYTHELFNWLTRVLYKQGRRRSVKDLQNFCIDPSKIVENSNLNMMLSPTVVHSYFKSKGYKTVSGGMLGQENDFTPPLRYELNTTSSSSSCFELIDQKKLIILLKKLYLEIRNNYDARILVAAIQKLSNHLKRTEERYRIKHSSISVLEKQSQGSKTKVFGSDLSMPNSGSRRISNTSSISTLSSDTIASQTSNPVSESCSVCLEPVIGLYTRCLNCKHGGHIRHIKDWFEDKTKCPIVDCKCKCIL